jgi:hypothetical protein
MHTNQALRLHAYGGPDAAQLGQIAAAVVAGRLKSTIADVVDRAGLADAIERNKRGHAPGKLVLDLTL